MLFIRDGLIFFTWLTSELVTSITSYGEFFFLVLFNIKMTIFENIDFLMPFY